MTDSGSKTLGEMLDQGALLRPIDTVTGSLALFRAVAAACGVDEWSHLLGQQDLNNLIDPSRHIVFVIVDGLGMNLREFWPRDGFFESTFLRELRAIFPSTTSTVLSSHATALWPADHGIPGWFAYLPERQMTVRPLIFDDAVTNRPLAEVGLEPADIIQGQPVSGRFTRNLCAFLPDRIRGSAYSTWARGGTAAVGYRTVDHGVRLMARWLKEQETPSYAYLYVPDVDHASHRVGWTNSAVHEEVAAADRVLSDLRLELGGAATILVTADHGHIVVPATGSHRLEEADPLLEDLLVPPTGEPRTPVFHTRPGAEDRFRQRFLSRFGQDFLLVPTDLLQKHALYGPGPLTEVMRARLGNWVGLATSAAVLEYIPRDAESLGFVGFHGGLSEDEMRVPLFVS